MTKQELKKRVMTCLEAMDYEKIVDRALSRGVIDIESHNEDDRGLVFVILCYVYTEVLNACQPNNKDDKKGLKNLLKF